MLQRLYVLDSARCCFFQPHILVTQLRPWPLFYFILCSSCVQIRWWINLIPRSLRKPAELKNPSEYCLRFVHFQDLLFMKESDHIVRRSSVTPPCPSRASGDFTCENISLCKVEINWPIEKSREANCYYTQDAFEVPGLPRGQYESSC